MNLEQLVKIIDHTSIWPKVTQKDIKKLCKEAIQYGFKSVFVNPYYVKYARDMLGGSSVAVGSTCGFPFGANRTNVKVFEAKRAIDDGADEIDMVINIGALKDKNYKIAERDINAVASVCERNKVICKVILEMPLLTQKEKLSACVIACDSGADFIKTCTGLWGPAKIEDVKLMKRIAGDKTAVKASGGIRSFKQVKEFVKAGAERIGTSAGVKIVKDFLKSADMRSLNADSRVY